VFKHKFVSDTVFNQAPYTEADVHRRTTVGTHLTFRWELHYLALKHANVPVHTAPRNPQPSSDLRAEEQLLRLRAEAEAQEAERRLLVAQEQLAEYAEQRKLDSQQLLQHALELQQVRLQPWEQGQHESHLGATSAAQRAAGCVLQQFRAVM
jgi:hypothetical protein